MKACWKFARALTAALLAGSFVVAIAQPAAAVEISAAVGGTAGTNHMGLPAPVGIFDPGTADFGAPGLAAPGSGTVSITVPFAYPSNAPNAGNPVQMYGDAVSSITNLGGGSFQLSVTLTNFWMDQGSPLPSNEYVYLNVWETFTGLGLPSNLTWSTSGNISVFGSWAAGPGGSVAMEPIAIVYDPSAPGWTTASPFFGANGTGPGSGPLVGSKAVSSLTPYVSSGQLVVGMQTILLLNDIPGAGGNSMNLPSSLHLSMTLTPVPEPSGLALALVGLASLGWWAHSTARRR
ncbi:MAG: PEP-CTERM sorting domain-containing protein [Planctomycetaceae bacterium]|nr:PEP-CTERM sorting domain-containing protein [Planctomycetaceae bacterium]